MASPSIDTCQVLEDFLLSYTGVLVIVSHDRYFLDKVCDHHFVLAGDGSGGLVDWQGTFSEYLDYREAKAALEAAATAAPPAAPRGAPPTSEARDEDDAAAAEEKAAAAAASKATRPLSDFEVRRAPPLLTARG